MTTRIILPLLTGIAVLATCLEGRYHLEATGLRHHRHDRHHRKVWDQELVVRGSRRRAWEENQDEERYVPRERFEGQRRWRNRVEERRDSKRDHYFRGDSRRPGSHSSGRTWGFRNPVEPHGGKWRQDEDAEEYEVRDRRRGRGRGWVYEDEDDGYEADDEEFYPPRRAPKPRKNRHEARRHRVEVEDEDEEYYEYDDEYEDDYEDYDVQETEPRPLPKHRGRKHEQRRKKGSNPHLNHEEDDVNEVEKREEDDKDEYEDDLWGENENENEDEDEEDYDETVDESSESGEEDSSTIKAIDEVIRSLKAKPPPTTPGSMTRRDYRNVETDRYVPGRGRSHHPYPYPRPYNRETVKPSPRHPHRTASKRTPSNWDGYFGTSTTTMATLARYTPKGELTAPVRNSTFGKVVKGKNKTSGAAVQTIGHPGIPDSRNKNIEQDYEEYENDGSDDKPEDVDDDADGENDDDKKWTSEKDQDYADEENEDEHERPALPPSTTTTTTSTLPPTTTSTTTTTTTTTTARPPPPPPVHTRPFDHRQARLSDARARSSALTNIQTTSTEYPPMSNYSAHKWITLGSRKAVIEARKTPNRHNPDFSKAIDHVKMMNKEGTCRLPRPRVVSVRDVYPSPSKTYKPHCTMLHRCADDTGCCTSDTTCVPKHIDTIELLFYASVIEGPTQVEKLKFENHTECECRPRRLRDTGQGPPSNIQKPKKSCKCPSNFASKITPEGECECTCPDNRIDCVRIRRGKDYFPVQDRWCIQNNICALPPCDFGEYMRKQGRCPQKMEKFYEPNYYGKRHVVNGYRSH